MPVQATKGAASAQGFGQISGGSGEKVYIEDVFSTWLYTGNGSTQTVTNGIDLSGKGGLVWAKCRSTLGYNALVDTVRGATKKLNTDRTIAQYTDATSINAFSSSGFTMGSDSDVNFINNTFTSWTFRKQPKFFDIVTYTGNGATGRNISHNLGSVPGCIIVRRYDTIAGWDVYHQSLGATKAINLHSTDAAFTDTIWNSTSPTSTVFTVSGSANTNLGTYVAYLFAHDAGGFGLSGTDNVISCGLYTTDGSGNATVNLGYEPQWLLTKVAAGTTGDWRLIDNMRGFSLNSEAFLRPNSSAAETVISPPAWTPSSSGFSVTGTGASISFIYIAIRRGPMKVPTSGTSVFAPLAYVGDQSTARRDLDVGFVVDAGLFLNRTRTDYSTSAFTDRLRGAKSLTTSSTSAESDLSGYLWFDDQNGIDVGQIGDLNPVVAGVGQTMVLECLKRAPSFFDVVCYTGDGVTTGRAINHNLGVAPELIIIKCRNSAYAWAVRSSYISSPNSNVLNLNNNTAASIKGNYFQGTPTSTTFTVGYDTAVNDTGLTYVAYLFATCAGVSKVGSYTGTGTTQQINCGFTGGARFVLIKRTDSTGDWYVWDSARGIVAGNDPYLLLNSTAAEVTSTDYIDTYSAGFEISSTAPAAINANGGTYIYLAIA